jgi:hypothetical protein
VDAYISYSMGVFELKQEDVHALALDGQHVPQPIIRSRDYFNLPLTSAIRLVCIIVPIASFT